MTMMSGNTLPDNGQQAPQAPIAICGMAVRLPGKICSIEKLYTFLRSGLDARSLPDQARYNAQAFCYQTKGSDEAGGQTTLPSEGYWLDWTELSSFDASVFPMAENEIEKLDPQQRILLRIAWESLESAGEDWQGKNIGCYVGSFGDDWRELHARDELDLDGSRLAGYMDFALSNRISSVLDLRGPSMTIRVACSASGLALHLACQAIRAGECDSAIVAGSNIILSPGFGLFMAEHGILSPEASCKTFDAQADGYARAEAVNCVYIKRLDFARRDGNPIRAIIRGSATNADGKTNRMSTPSPEAQEALIRSAYRMAGISDLCATALVECHGTGTTVGDTVETCAIARVFGEKGVTIGSTKPALGHSEGASALTSVIKAVLSLEHRTILPNIKFNSSCLRIPLKSGHLLIPTTPQTWPSDRLERISINSFGIGGTNVHIILDSAETDAPRNSQTSSQGSNAHITPPPSPTSTRNCIYNSASLLLFSATNEESLHGWSEEVLTYRKRYPHRLADISYTLARRRVQRPLRSYRVIDERGESYPKAPVPAIRVSKQKGTAGIVFVFTGQGASWARMGIDLLKSDTEFLSDIRAMDAVLKALPSGRCSSWRIQSELFRSGASSRLDQAEFSQPACTALQIALVRRLERHGVIPGAVIGHSSGEIAAAYTAGVLTLEAAITTAYYRGFICRKSTRGGMLAVGLGDADVFEFLVPQVTVACENSNANVTLSGPVEALEKVSEAIRTRRPEVLVRSLRVNNAYHSGFMAGAAEEYLSVLQAAALRPRTPSKPFYSSVKGRRLDSESDFGAHYWRDSVVKPVLFRQAVKALLTERPISVHVEIGPDRVLSSPLKQINAEIGVTVASVPVMHRGMSATTTFLVALGELHCHGIPVELPIPKDAKALADLPPYPWKLSKTYWAESRVMRNWRFRKFPHHELLGIRNADDSDVAPIWRCMLSVDDVKWIKDHCIGSEIVFPAAAYVAMAGEIVFQLTGSRAYTIQDFSVTTVLTLEAGCRLEIMAAVKANPGHSEWREFSIMSFKDNMWTTHCTGIVRPGRVSRGPQFGRTLPNSHLRTIDAEKWYRCAARVGYRYGPDFKGLEDIRASVSTPSVKLIVREPASASSNEYQRETAYSLHPRTLDKVFQALVISFHSDQPCLNARLLLPTHAAEIFVDGGVGMESLHVEATAAVVCTTGPGNNQGDIIAFKSSDPQKGLVFYAKDFSFSPGDYGLPEPEPSNTS